MKKKKILIFLFAVIILFIFAVNTYAAFADVLTGGTDSYKPVLQEGNSTKAESIINVILRILTSAGAILAVIILAIMGLKYMMGSVEEKVEFKQSMVPFLIGMVMLFGITTIVGLILKIGNNF